ncbi:hypothetical protein HX13_13340 [Chryseobacterium sp. P1-3]|uniref:Uncharacterized protein n=1 Tax=Chryseobacterium gallinarum TaxID=1324352 RepID=A0A0G3M9T9_CHRGL|nr:hypothetical protein OK18_15545 [Chryseobacterium gallinarum]KFF74937.1 hypothetical protein HX13_13340 [Chryseobacterium sp. P1-3]
MFFYLLRIHENIKNLGTLTFIGKFSSIILIKKIKNLTNTSFKVFQQVLIFVYFWPHECI